MPPSGTPGNGSRASPSTALEETIVGSTARGMRNTPSIASSQSRVASDMSCVRLALVTSVTWSPPSGPPVRFQTSQESMVPNRAVPSSAFARAPSTWSSSQASLEAEK